jgi:hypothetical protein
VTSPLHPNVFLPARIAAWSLATAIAALSVIPPGLRPETGVPHDLEHSLIYAVAGFAFGLGYGRRRVQVAILLLLFSGVVEVAQLFVPGRHARFSDFIVDALSVCAGFVAAAIASRSLGRFDFPA